MKRKLVAICAVLMMLAQSFCVFAVSPDYLIGYDTQTAEFYADSEESAELFAVAKGYKFQFYKYAVIREPLVDGNLGKRLFEKPTSDFAISWNIYSATGTETGVLFSAIYQKETVDGKDILTLHDVKIVDISGLGSDLYRGPCVTVNHKALDADKDYVAKATLVDTSDTLKCCGISWYGMVETRYINFDFQNNSMYQDMDGMG